MKFVRERTDVGLGLGVLVSVRERMFAIIVGRWMFSIEGDQ